jgi:hypothetical protein
MAYVVRSLPERRNGFGKIEEGGVAITAVAADNNGNIYATG